MRTLVVGRDAQSRTTALTALSQLDSAVVELDEPGSLVQRALDLRPDLVVVDVDSVATRELKAVLEQVPGTNLLMTVAAGLAGNLDPALLVVGASDFLVKPFSIEQLLHRVRTLGALHPTVPPDGGAAAPSSIHRTLLGLHDDASGRLDAKKIAGFLQVPLKALADGMGWKYRTVHKTPSSAALQPDLQPLRRAIEVLLELVDTPAAARAWLNTPSPDLADHAPIELLRTGHADSVLAILEHAAVGAPT